MKRYLSIMAITIILLSFWACKRTEEQPIPQAPARQGPIIENPNAIPDHGITVPKVEFQVVVPPEVKEQWVAVKLIVNDKKTNKRQEFTVKIGEEFKIPDSGLTVRIGHFLPDFKISGQVVTSASNDLNNPSVGIVIHENGKQIFPESGKWGWLYANFPTIHSFQHKRYGLILKEGVKK